MSQFRCIGVTATFFILGCLTAACSSSPAIAQDDPSFLSPRVGHATLTVVRDLSVVDDGCTYALAIDSTVAGQLTPGGWITMYPPAGPHVVSLRPQGSSCPAGTETRMNVETAGSHRLQLVRTKPGALQWKVDDNRSAL